MSRETRIGVVVSDIDGELDYNLAKEIFPKYKNVDIIPLPHKVSLKTRKTLRKCSGFIIFGGFEDVCPELYGNKRILDGDQVFDRTLDEFEIYLVKYAMRKKTPLLGICRGMQIINTIFGGTLSSVPNELRSVHSTDWQYYLDTGMVQTHNVDILDTSILHKIIGESCIAVDSFHHQCIAKLGEGLIVSAKCENIIEAIEIPKHPNILAIQWHPEYMSRDKYQSMLFDYFYELCSK